MPAGEHGFLPEPSSLPSERCGLAKQKMTKLLVRHQKGLPQSGWVRPHVLLNEDPVSHDEA